MGVLKLALEEGGPQNLELFWGEGWRNLQIELNDQPVGSVEDPLQLEHGVEFTLPDGNVLHVQLVHVVATELRVMLNGVPLPDSASDPIPQARSATYMLYGMAAFTTASSMVLFVVANDPGTQLPMTLANVLFGGFLAVLGFFMFKRSRVAPLVAILLFAVDTLTTTFEKMTTPEGLGLSDMSRLVVRIFIFSVLTKGFLGARELARRGKQGPATVPPAVGPVAASPATSPSLGARTGTG
ncbi:hypothetical protein D7Y21_35105 [Corallococcus sp. AB045]|uniref:hypothetical protein n=1 Tax=Corallococcus sp. AB045 TaxID=2316719 RepID=UPI000EF0A417|nr:hypothetical protein [Corallococcus sp. AB045]RKH78782.1 hypothetical protein D7Y21_35105 [Corallococcus sp. AB045]